MNENQPFGIGTFGRFVIFSGVGMAFMAVFSFASKRLDRSLNETTLLCVVFGMLTVSVFGVMYFFRRCPERMIIPIGIVGWFLAFLLIFLRDRFQGG